MTTMSIADQTEFARIISAIGSAPLVPFDSTAAEQLAGIAVRVGFVATTGDFMLKIIKSPTAALLEFGVYAAGQVVLAAEGGVPEAPTVVGLVDDQSPGTFSVAWFGSDGDLGYLLDLSTVADFSSFVGVYQDLSVSPGPPAHYHFSGLTAGVTYYCRARAVNAVGVSDYSSTVTGTIVVGIPAAPVATGATNLTSDGFTANWNAAAGADLYEYEVINVATNYMLNGSTTDLFVATAIGYAQPLSAYSYRVRGMNFYNMVGPWSNSISVATLATEAPQA